MGELPQVWPRHRASVVCVERFCSVESDLGSIGFCRYRPDVTLGRQAKES